jgi:hypothetical protein
MNIAAINWEIPEISYSHVLRKGPEKWDNLVNTHLRSLARTTHHPLLPPRRSLLQKTDHRTPLHLPSSDNRCNPRRKIPGTVHHPVKWTVELGSSEVSVSSSAQVECVVRQGRVGGSKVGLRLRVILTFQELLLYWTSKVGSVTADLLENEVRLLAWQHLLKQSMNFNSIMNKDWIKSSINLKLILT